MVKTAKSGPNTRAFYIAIAVLAAAGIIALSYASTRPKETPSTWDSTLPKMDALGHVMGSDSAKLEVIEFGDFECPSCGRFATITEPDVRAKLVNTGIIRLRFMDFPLSGHKNTLNAHRAAWCAGDQNKFWEMHDAIYANQDRWSGEATDTPDKILGGIAQGIGLNIPQYQACIQAKKYQAQLQSNETEAIKRGISETPTFVIGSQVVPGALTFDQFKNYVDQALAAQTPKKQ